MAIPQHSTLDPFECHPPVVVGFTGLATSYTPAASGILVVKTDDTPNPTLWRTTGKSAGSLEQIGGAAASAPTFGPNAPISAPTTVGDLYYQIASDRSVVWVADQSLGGTLAWRAVGGTAVIRDTSPSGSFISDYAGQLYLHVSKDGYGNVIGATTYISAIAGTNNRWYTT